MTIPSGAVISLRAATAWEAASDQCEDTDLVLTWPDQSGNALDFGATGTDRPTWKANDGDGAPALRFDGNDVLSRADNATYQPSGAFTWTGWVKVNSNAADYEIVTKWSTATGGEFIIRTSNTGQMLFVCSDGANTATFTYNAWNPTTGVWHHIACVFDGTLASNKLKFYKNGALQTPSSTAGTPPTAVQNTAQPLLVGGITGTTSFRLNGAVGDSDFYKRALTASEVVDHMNATARVAHVVIAETLDALTDALAARALARGGVVETLAALTDAATARAVAAAAVAEALAEVTDTLAAVALAGAAIDDALDALTDELTAAVVPVTLASITESLEALTDAVVILVRSTARIETRMTREPTIATRMVREPTIETSMSREPTIETRMIRQ